MSATIVLVDAEPANLQRMAAALEGLAPLRCASPEDARQLLSWGDRDRDLIVCVGPQPGPDGAGPLARAAPDSLRLALTSSTDGASVRALLNDGGVSLVFAWPDELDQLRAAVARTLSACAARHRSEETLADFHQVLRTGPTLTEIAEATARALFGVLEGRPVLVQLWDEGGLVADGVRIADSRDPHWVEAGRGGEMSSGLHNRRLSDGQRPIGEVVVDVGEVSGSRARTLALIEQICVPAELAAGACIRQREGDRAVHGALMAIGGLAGSREHGNRQHVRRVAEYVRLVALGLREDGHFVDELTDEGIDDIVRAVPLHDIGKLEVPDAILLKPDRLSSEEWRVVQRHPSAGADVLEQALSSGGAPRFLSLARDAARDHHEKWDGTGYPRGLVGEHIPLVARLLALAGIYDALTTHRPYRAARTHADALRIVDELAGSHLDPRVVDAFLARADQADAIRERLRDDRPVGADEWV